MALEPYELTLNGPGKNALGTALMRRIVDEVRAAAGRPLLVVGAGDAFSAGLNLKEVAALDRPGMEAFLGQLDDVIDALYGHEAPTVACVNGHAIAGGCVVALCCDVRIAADDPRVRIGLNEVPLGLEFPPKILALARRRLPAHAIDRVVLEGGLHDPRTALALGLIDEVAADAHVSARAWLARLAEQPAAAYAATKRALHAGALDLSPEQRREFREHVVPAWCAPETRERVQAALGRRR
jgi:enoyl-CoA hydratase/carnithine racemase